MDRREAIKRGALLFGLTLTPALLRGALAAPAAPAAGAAAKPQHLDAVQFATLGAAVERIIPRTDTPGAADVGVAAFIDFMLGDYLPKGEQESLREALRQLESRAQAAHQQGFVTLDAARQDAVIGAVASSTVAADKSAFQQLRTLTVLGYFSSETVGTTVLGYDPVPGRFQGCIPVSEVGNKAWYTSR